MNSHPDQASPITTTSTGRPAMDEDFPDTDDQPLPPLIPAAVNQVLLAAQIWPSWDGVPIRHGADIGAEWTPHKVLRRVADHLVDHLAELEARLAGERTAPDAWAGRTVTTAADRVPFTATDVAEAHQRLSRLADIWRLRLTPLGNDVLDHRPDPATWTLREVAHHLARATRYYAQQMTPSA